MVRKNRVCQEGCCYGVSKFVKGADCCRKELRPCARPVVHVDIPSLCRRIDPNDTVGPDHQPCLSQRAERLEAHRPEDNVAPHQQAPQSLLPSADCIWCISATQAQDADSFLWYRKARQRVNQPNHDGVVGPNSPIEKDISAIFQRSEVRGGSCCGRRYLHHLLSSIRVEVGVVGCLEHIHVPVPAIAGRYTKPGLRFTQCPTS